MNILQLQDKFKAEVEKIFYKSPIKSKKTLAKFVWFALPKPRFDFITNFVSLFHVNFQRNFFFLVTFV